MSSVSAAEEASPPSENNHSEVMWKLRADSLANSALILLALTVIQRIIGFGRSVLFCRWLDPQELGRWEMAFSFLLLASPVAVLGLPGSFGRYLEYYRQRGQLRTFLKRATLGTAVLAGMAIAAIVLAAPQFSQLIFGNRQSTNLVRLLAGSLTAIIVHHYLESLLSAMRVYRVVSMMQFCQSLCFASLGVILVWFWRPSVESVVIAYGGGCFISASAAIVWLRRPLQNLPLATEPLGQQVFWSKLLSFSIWVWVTNLFTNLFAVVDRYMIVHYSGMSANQALAEVGDYHSSRVVPLLLVSVAVLLSSMVMPYLSHDWEAGRRKLVSDRLNLVLKLSGLGMITAAVGILFIAPLLFEFAFTGKFAGGLKVLPWTLAYCVWFGTLMIAQNYLWCAEKTRWCGVVMLVGLLCNVFLNLFLLPRWGLIGAVMATAAANFLALVMVYRLSQKFSMQVHRGTWIVALAPLAVGFGVWPATGTMLVLLTMVLGTDWMLSHDEKHLFCQTLRGYRQKISDFLGHSAASAD